MRRTRYEMMLDILEICKEGTLKKVTDLMYIANLSGQVYELLEELIKKGAIRKEVIRVSIKSGGRLLSTNPKTRKVTGYFRTPYGTKLYNKWLEFEKMWKEGASSL